MFHVTPEGEKYKKGVNWWRAPGWGRLVFFCGDCRLYFRFRWRGGLRLFCHWDLRKNEEPPRHWVWTGEEFIPDPEDGGDDGRERFPGDLRIHPRVGWDRVMHEFWEEKNKK